MSISSFGLGSIAVHCDDDVTAPSQKRGRARRWNRVHASSISPASTQ